MRLWWKFEKHSWFWIDKWISSLTLKWCLSTNLPYLQKERYLCLLIFQKLCLEICHHRFKITSLCKQWTEFSVCLMQILKRILGTFDWKSLCETSWKLRDFDFWKHRWSLTRVNRVSCRKDPSWYQRNFPTPKSSL